MTTPKMNPDVKAQWLAALRSGDYKQVTGALKREFRRHEYDGVTEVGYCCLGVLCEVAVKNDVIEPSVPQEGYTAYWTYDGANETLPDGVREWAGLADISPSVPSPYGDGGTRIQELAYLNDDQGKTFAEIADLIEAGL